MALLAHGRAAPFWRLSPTCGGSWSWDSLIAVIGLVLQYFLGVRTLNDTEKVVVSLVGATLIVILGSFLRHILAVPAAIQKEKQEQLQYPKITLKITECRFADPPPRSAYSLASLADLKHAGFSSAQGSGETRIIFHAHVENEHRVATPVALGIRVTDTDGSQRVGLQEPLENSGDYPPLELTALIQFAQPRSGWMLCAVRQRRACLLGGMVTVSVTDGTGAVTTASTEIADSE
jgi:hypothetical protein